MNILDIANNLPGGNNQQNSQFAPSPNDSPRIRALKEKLAKREALRKENSRVTDAQKAIQQQGRQDILRTPQVQSAEDYASTTLGNTEEAQAQDVGAQVMGTASSAVAGADKYNEGSEFNVDAVYADAMTKFSENFMVGLGNMIGDYGNIAQVVGSALGINSLAEGNFLSRGLQSIGNEMASEHAMYIPPELQDRNFSISTMLNPDFWLIHGAQFTPQLLEILGTMGAGSAVTQLTKHGLERGLTKYFAKELGETAVEKGALNHAIRNLNNLNYNIVSVCPSYVETSFNKGKDLPMMSVQYLALVVDRIVNDFYKFGIKTLEIVVEKVK